MGLVGYRLNEALSQYLRLKADGLNHSTPALAPTTGPWLLERRLSPAQVQSVLTRFADGRTTRQLAQETGVSKAAIVALLRRHGVPVRSRGNPSSWAS